MADTTTRHVQIGRPRDDRRTQVILEAAIDLMVNVGYDKITVQDIAAKAGTGLDTIYRRWGSKHDLMAEAIRATPPIEVEHDGDPEEHLRAVTHAFASSYSATGSKLAALAMPIKENPNFADAIEGSIRNQIVVFRDAISDCVPEANPGRAESAADFIIGMMMFRSTFRTGAIDPETTTDELVREALAIARE